MGSRLFFNEKAISVRGSSARAHPSFQSWLVKKLQYWQESNPLIGIEQVETFISFVFWFHSEFIELPSLSISVSLKLTYIFISLTFLWSCLAFVVSFPVPRSLRFSFLNMLIFLHTFAYRCWFGLSCRGKRRFWSWRTCVLKTMPTTAASPPSGMCVGSLIAVLSSDSQIRQVLLFTFLRDHSEYNPLKVAVFAVSLIELWNFQWTYSQSFWLTCAVPIIVIKMVQPLLLPLQLPHPSNCWWRIPSWWILARRCPWCASPQVESRRRLSPGSAVTTACHRGAWWRAARSHFRPSPQMRRESTAAWPATTWETRRRSPPPLWFEVSLSSLYYMIRAPSW